MIRKAIRKLSGALTGQTGQTGQTPEAEARPHYHAAQAFDRPHYADMTEARLRHLRTLGLDLRGKSVLDVGCGIGRLAEFFDEAGCKVCCADGRAENIEQMKQLYPGRRGEVLDVEKERLERLGRFEVVFCYGLLYHVTDVDGVIEKCAAVCAELLLLETCITPIDDPIVRLVRENPKDVTQALRGWGSRPSPAYIETCLRLNGFQHVYAPRQLPDHPQFHYKYVKDLSKFSPAALARDIFIASRTPLANPNLDARKCPS